MAIAATAVWEVRTTGSNNNGGGYNPARSVNGVDRSQQDAEHVFIDGSTITATVHTTTTQITIVGYSVSNADLGNHLNITGGTATAGVYEITAVDTGNNRWTLDRSAGTSTQTVVGRMGGAFATLAQANTASTNGNTIWITGTFTHSSTVQMTGCCKNVIGYGSSRGDEGFATINAGANSIIVVGVGSSHGCSFRNLSIDGNGYTGVIGCDTNNVHGQVSVYTRCKVVDCDIGFRLLSSRNVASAFNCWALTCVTGFSLANSATAFYCVSEECSTGFHLGGGGNGSNVSFCLAINNTGNGFTGGGAANSCGVSVLNCVAYGNGSNGLNIVGVTGRYVVQNCIFSNNGAYGVSCSTSFNYIAEGNNAYYANTSGSRNNFPSGNNDVILSADPFTNAAANDFTLNNDTSGGALLRGGGFPGELLGLPGVIGYVDIGVYQHQDSGGGGGTTRFPVIWGGRF